MDIKTACNIIDIAYEKTAYITEEFMEKEAGLRGAFNVLTGKNVEQAAKNLENAKKIGHVGKVTEGVADAVQGVTNDIKNSKSSQLTDFMKSKGIKLDKNGDKLKTQYHKLGKDQLKGELKLTQDELRQKGSELGNTKKDVKATIEKIKSQKKQEFSDKENRISAAMDNLVNHKSYKNNRKYNEKLDGIISQMKDGKQLSVDELKTENGLFGKRKVNLGYEKDIHQYNKNLQAQQRAEKQLNRSKNNMNDINHELNYQSNIDDINKKRQSIDTMNTIGKATEKIRSYTNEGLKAVSPLTNVGVDALENKVKQEAARTTRARVGVGAGLGAAAVGAGALNHSKSSSDDNVTKVAEAIIEMALMEK